MSRHVKAARLAPVTVYLIEPHIGVRRALAEILRREPDLCIVGQAGTADEALTTLESVEAHVIVAEDRLPDMSGIALCRAVAERRLRAQVVLLCAFPDGNAIRGAFLSGARGYVVKDADLGQLKQAIRRAAQLQSTLDPVAMSRRFGSTTTAAAGPLSAPRASELQVLTMLLEGTSSREVATLTGEPIAAIKALGRELRSTLSPVQPGEGKDLTSRSQSRA